MSPDEADRLITDLFDSSYYMLVRYSLRAVQDRSIAEDVVQQALMLLYRNIRQGTVIDNPKAWTFSVIRRLISQHLRTQQRQTALHEPLSVLDDSPAQVVNPKEPGGDLNEVNKLFSVLSPREKDVIALRMTSLKYREIADRLGISPKSVNTLLARALRKLQKAVNAKSKQGPGSKHVESISTKTLH
jgi:RNA polymerase sigma factor (sigma-70 family)